MNLDDFDIDPDEPLLKMDGFDDCIVGVLERFGQPLFIVYDKEKVIDALMRDGVGTYEDAVEFYEFNQLGSWLGATTPGFLISLTPQPDDQNLN